MSLIWIIAAFIAGVAAKAIRLPTLVGYLGAGIVLALFGVESNAFIETAADFGVALLLFTVGLHINYRSLIQPQVLGVGSIHLIISIAVFTLVLTAYQVALFPAFLIASGLSFSSTVLTAKSLDARKELDSYHGRLAIGILILQDVVAILLLAVSGSGAPTWWALALLGLPILRPFLLNIISMVGKDELMIIYGLLLALGTGEIFDLVGLDAKLGALVMGMLLSGDERADDLYDTMWGLKEIFLVSFFLQIGLGGLPDANGWLTIGVLLLFLPLKGLLFFGLMIWYKLRARTSFLSSVSLTAYSEFALIVVAAASASGLVEPQYVVITGLLVAISYVINAPISSFVNQLWERFEPTLIRYQREVRHPDQEPQTLGAADYVILGMGRAGTSAYDYLIEQGRRPIGFDDDPPQIQRQLQAGRRVIYADANDPALWTDLDISGIQGVLITVDSVTPSINAARNLREEGFDGFVAALLRDPDNKEALEEAGVSVSILPIARAGRELAEACMLDLDKKESQDEAVSEQYIGVLI
ncbi:MAG: cation:proton antiporter family protein [Chloroflexota bacterium]